MEMAKEITHKGRKIVSVRDSKGQEFFLVPSLYENIGFCSISDAKREIEGKQLKWRICVL